MLVYLYEDFLSVWRLVSFWELHGLGVPLWQGDVCARAQVMHQPLGIKYFVSHANLFSMASHLNTFSHPVKTSS